MDKILEIAGFLIGLLYIWWEYHADAKLWIASIVMPSISMWIYFRSGLYADFAINIYYFFMAIYGYAAWTRHTHKKERPDLPITHIPAMMLVAATGGLAALWALIAFGLTYTNSNVVIYDAFTTALSIVGTWMLARKYIEQWIAWILVDTVCVGLYIYKGIYFYATLYAIYTVIAFFGYWKWKRLMAAESSSD